MKYKVLDNGTAVIVDRQPVVVRDKLLLEFVDAPQGATAVVSVKETTYYRRLEDGACDIPKEFLTDCVKVFIAVLGGDKVQRVICENLRAERLEDGGVLVSPDDMNLPLIVSQLRVENEELREMVGSVSNRVNLLEKQLDKLVKGHALL